MTNFSMASAGRNIIGTTFGEPVTAREALEKCGADFEVGLQPIIAANHQLASLLDGGMAIDGANTRLIDGQQFVSIDMLREGLIDDYRATMRMDNENPLGIVSDSYGVVQNQHAFDFLDLLTTGELDGEQALITSAGSLLGGRRVFVQAKFPEPVRMAGNNNDIIDMYISVSTSHDGSGAVNVAISPIRIYCTNSLQLALKECESKLTFKHTLNVNARMDLLNKQNADMAYRTLKLYDTYKQFYEGALAELGKIKLTEKQMEEVLVKSVLSKDVVKLYNVNKSLDSEEISTRSRNIINSIMAANFTGVGQEYITEKNTGLSIVNALTTYYQNDANWADPEKKFLAINEGSVQQKLQNLYSNILAIAA